MKRVSTFGEGVDTHRFRPAAFRRGHGDQRVADVVQRAVDRLDEQMHRRRLPRAGDDKRLSFVGNEVVRAGGQPFVLAGEPRGGIRRERGHEFL